MYKISITWNKMRHNVSNQHVVNFDPNVHLKTYAFTAVEFSVLHDIDVAFIHWLSKSWMFLWTFLYCITEIALKNCYDYWIYQYVVSAAYIFEALLLHTKNWPSHHPFERLLLYYEIFLYTSYPSYIKVFLAQWFWELIFLWYVLFHVLFSIFLNS